MRPSFAGILTGLVLGLALVLEGFPEMLVVALFGAIGYLVVKIAEGELDLSRYIGGDQPRRRS